MKCQKVRERQEREEKRGGVKAEEQEEARYRGTHLKELPTAKARMVLTMTYWIKLKECNEDE